jgi:peptide/nickel transport system ATP-binding protein
MNSTSANSPLNTSQPTGNASVSASPILSVRDLRVNFRIDKNSEFEAVKKISFDMGHRETVALVGESGSGKSVTSLAIMGLLPKENSRVLDGSSVKFNGRELVGLSQAQMREIRGDDLSMIFQEPMSSLNPVFRVGDQIAETLREHRDLSRGAARARSIELLEEVGIPEPQRRVDMYPHEMSGGQQQRVMIAMAISCEPKLLIADEPTTALDVTIQRQILELLAKLQKQREMSILFITHDLAVVGEIADRVVVMRHGEIREQGAAQQIFTSPQDSYTKGLLACRPAVGTRPLRLAVIEDFLDGVRKDIGTVGSGQTRDRGIKPDDEVLLKVEGLCKDFVSREGLFGKRVFNAVKDVSFNLVRGKTLGVVGESGSGKTTVGLTLMRLHQATKGKAIYQGKDLLAMSNDEFKAYKRRIQIVFQNPYASLNPRFTVGQIITEPMLVHAIGANESAREKMAFDLLDKVGLPKVSFYKYPHEFSGGQRQRIAIARCLTMNPEILICDESVSALDVSVQAQVLNLLQDLQDEFKTSYIFISHDLAVVHYMADEVLVMNKGEVVEQGDSDEIYQSPKHSYTKMLLGAVPKGLKG